MEGIGVSETWGIQGTKDLQVSTVESSDHHNGRGKRVGRQCGRCSRVCNGSEGVHIGSCLVGSFDALSEVPTRLKEFFPRTPGWK